MRNTANEVGRIARLLQRQINQSVLPAGVTRQQYQILSYIYRQEKDVYQRDVEAYFSMPRSTVSGLMKELELAGYIRRSLTERQERAEPWLAAFLAELVLRMGNILKRSAPPQVAALEQVAFGPYVFHLERGELRQGDEIIHLTDREREMLRILSATPGETVPRGALTSGGTVNERAVDVQINRLRRKIEHDPANPLFLQAVRGIGYRLVASP